MAVTKTDITSRWGEFSGISDAQWTAFIADALLQVNVDVWGSKYTLGVIYLVAHFAKVSKMSGASGPVSSETVGQVSRTYKIANFDQWNEYGSTGYGLSYLRMLYSLPLARLTVA